MEMDLKKVQSLKRSKNFLLFRAIPQKLKSLKSPFSKKFDSFQLEFGYMGFLGLPQQWVKT